MKVLDPNTKLLVAYWGDGLRFHIVPDSNVTISNEKLLFSPGRHSDTNNRYLIQTSALEYHIGFTQRSNVELHDRSFTLSYRADKTFESEQETLITCIFRDMRLE